VKKKKENPSKVLDILTSVKYPQRFPWKFKDNSLKEISCIGVFEFVPGKLRGKFMDEVYRILIDGGKATFSVAYWNGARSIQDYRYEWPPLCEQSFLYFNKGWREVNKLDLGLVCDFDYNYGYSATPETVARNDESRSFYIAHYNNTVDALHLIMTKRKPSK